MKHLIFSSWMKSLNICSLIRLILLNTISMKSINKKKSILFFTALFVSLSLVMAFYSNSLFQMLYAEKVWAHKINSIEELKQVANKYSGIELDIVFHSDLNQFEVNHPPDTSLNLFLDEYLQTAHALDPDLKFWLDFKNLNSKNDEQALIELTNQIELIGITKSRIIVESVKAELLQAYKKSGFLTCYYLPQNLTKMEATKQKFQLAKVKKNLELNLNYISSNYVDYRFVNEHFTNQKKLFWFAAYGSMSKFKARLLLHKIQNDQSVDILLMPYD